ncbi:cytidylate kinase [Chitinophaga costaii]|uniref:Cytidylate kinase n=1 Tax=Chitinophaga costaii TaxID=1335309 RepID=A0A1C4DD66_9BACT|nr:(d)CMP kinase [Chitinophaga costaii]PUZ24573.1 (d)CMP kinase [Chitinophaga costaii]SCC29309.1 cytidylate kinase [Chitinophaga costaii]
MKKIVITIDGYSSCGKSTLARQLARQLNYVYIDSGAMYRAITLYFIYNGVQWEQPEAVAAALSNIELEFLPNDQTGFSEIHLNGENVEHQIREMLVADKVSDVAAIGAVRSFAVAQQQKMGIHKGIIMDGRDIGTTVFPLAELKIFMTADTAIRVERRFRELFANNPLITIQEVKENLERRDYIDTNRAISPLRKAEDAIVLDNSNLTMDEQLVLAMQWVEDILLLQSS